MTTIIRISARRPAIKPINLAAEILKSGRLVAFPTETVYGLGANALDKTAVAKIFAAKGRPSDNPLIVHIADPKQLEPLVKTIPLPAAQLIKAFWPGPLTLVFPKSSAIPPIVTAQQKTVAVRCPSHPIAHALLAATGLPIAAPSANTSSRPSPTTAQHVIDDLYGRVDAIIDGGNTTVGLESTVLDVSTKIPTLLRPGSITKETIEKIIGPIAVAGKHTAIKSPGLIHKHYSPQAKVILLPPKPTLHDINIARGKIPPNQTAIILRSPLSLAKSFHIITMPGSMNNYAKKLFATIRTLDQGRPRLMLIESVSPTGLGVAIMDRLTRAAGK